ncbi:iron uptake transporter deferrochelatase/peroxidase subunit [Marisediminicola senii]|uniref:iron uptake transporter deferrochelatase/peroxidase subunit n=1 Tax=Marisediminicola senii TaxID=2711233 RepID=UPI0013ED321B|nr:iron uptake transporter deferrochelatase/peroxidase subunit [Marisediminicola senii]
MAADEAPGAERLTATPSANEQPGLSRRRLLGLVGAGAVGAGVGIAADRAVLAAGAAMTSGAASSYPFYGTHQSGIVTAAQDRLHFASFDVGDISRDELIYLLRDWTVAAAQLTRGLDAGDGGAVGGAYDAPPSDTGEAIGLPPAGLTITVGFGPGLFQSADGRDRFGLASRRPEELIDLPHFSGDALVESQTGGDLCIQACSDDPQVAVHAVRNLSRIAFGRASIRWSQLGFGRTSSTTRGQVTSRNLFGFKDGTANVKAEDTALVNDHVWASAAQSQPWMAGGSFLVARKIRMTIETWDRASLREQERVIGRTKGDGAPLTGGDEFAGLDLDRTTGDGIPLIDEAAHVRLAHPDSTGGAVLLRRGYNFVDGNDDLGRLSAGLFFLCYQSDPRTQFVPVQANLAANDAMNEYVRHIGSAIFAVPPGASEGSYLGAPLFA